MSRDATHPTPRRIGLATWPLVGLVLVAGGLPTACAAQSNHQATEPADATYVPYLSLRDNHPSLFVRPSPPPKKSELDPTPEGAEVVSYASEGRELRGWFAKPEGPGPFPAILYFHGDFSLDAHDFEAVRPFLDRGYAVFTPALRAENGNPGERELLYGEVDDGLAAARWLAARDDVDAEHIVAVGHSVGGAVAAMLSLYPSAPLTHTVSIGGIYVPETFVRWRKMERNAPLVRFDPTDPAEARLRTLGPNVRDMVRPHLAYVGEGDTWFHDNVRSVADGAQRYARRFEVVMVPGDHMSSLEPALQDLAARLDDVAVTEPGPP